MIGRIIAVMFLPTFALMLIGSYKQIKRDITTIIKPSNIRLKKGQSMDRNETGTKEKEIRELHNRIVVLEKLVFTLNEKVEKLEELIKIENKFKDWKA